MNTNKPSIKKQNHHLFDRVFAPVLTEKAHILSRNENSKRRSVVFFVDRLMNKKEIKITFEKALNVKVFSVRTITIGGTHHDMTKLRRKSGKGLQKKAIITLEEGQDLFLGEI